MPNSEEKDGRLFQCLQSGGARTEHFCLTRNIQVLQRRMYEIPELSCLNSGQFFRPTCPRANTIEMLP